MSARPPAGVSLRCDLGGMGSTSPPYSISVTAWPLLMGGRSEITSFTVTVRSGAPSVCGTAEYCNRTAVDDHAERGKMPPVRAVKLHHLPTSTAAFLGDAP